MKKILLIGLAVMTLLYGCGEEEKTDMCKDYDRLHFLSLISGLTHIQKKIEVGERGFSAYYPVLMSTLQDVKSVLEYSIEAGGGEEDIEISNFIEMVGYDLAQLNDILGNPRSSTEEDFIEKSYDLRNLIQEGKAIVKNNEVCR